MSLRDRVWPYLIIGLAGASVSFVLVDVPHPLRAVVVLAFAVIGPGMALVRLLRLGEPWTELVLAVVVSLALAAVVAAIPVYLGAWNPALSLLVLVAMAGGAVLADYLRRPAPPE